VEVQQAPGHAIQDDHRMTLAGFQVADAAAVDLYLALFEWDRWS
jgi:hypothetical protein